MHRDEECVFCTLPQWDGFSQDVLNIEPLNPVVPGHRIFISRQHVADAAEEPQITGALFEYASRYAKTQLHDFNLIVNAGVLATQTVMHLHVHYIPRRMRDDLRLPWTGQVRE